MVFCMVLIFNFFNFIFGIVSFYCFYVLELCSSVIFIGGFEFWCGVYRREVKFGFFFVGVWVVSVLNFGDLVVMVCGFLNVDIFFFVGFGIELWMLIFFCGFWYRIMNDLDFVCFFDGEWWICGRWMIVLGRWEEWW